MAKSNVWDINCGHSSRNKESKEAYRRFRIYLEMGPSRNVNKLSSILKIPRQNLYVQAKTYNWADRVEAYDTYIAKANQIDSMNKKVDGLSPLPEVNVLTPDPEVINPDVIDYNAVTAKPDRHTQEISLYQRQFKGIGQSLANEALATLELAKDCREVIQQDAERYKKAVEDGAHDKALSIAKRMSEKIKQYTMLGGLAVNYGNSSRTLWGDAIGINTVLQYFYTMQQNVKSDAKGGKRG